MRDSSRSAGMAALFFAAGLNLWTCRLTCAQTCDSPTTASEIEHPDQEFAGPAEFGWSADVDSTAELAVVGAPSDYNVGTLRGRAYLFELTAGVWTYDTYLEDEFASHSDAFGTSVSISGTTVAVGSPYEDSEGTNEGAVFVFDATTPTLVKKITLSSSSATNLGFSVAIDGDYLVAGEPTETSGPGAAHVFERDEGGTNNWGKVATLTPGAGADEFGYSVDVDGDVIVVGAPGSSSPSDAGRIYVYRLDEGTWSEEDVLQASSPVEDARLGCSVSVCGDVIVAGAPFDDDEGANAEAAHVFGYDGDWAQEAKLFACDAFGGGGQQFGGSVSVTGNTVLVGATQNGDGGFSHVYRIIGSHWGHVAKIAAANPEDEFDGFGHAVAIDGGDSVVGAPRFETAGAIFQFDDLNTISVISCPGAANNDGEVGINDFLAVLGAWGPCTSCPEDFDGDDVVGISDFLVLLGNWGLCHVIEPGDPGITIAEAVDEAGLDENDWNEQVDIVVDEETDDEVRDNIVCWMEHYLDCHRDPFCIDCSCECSDDDPFGGHN